MREPWERFAPKEDEDYRAFVRRQPCVRQLSMGHEQVGETEPHHVRAKRRFGDWLEDGSGNLAPLCHGCHREVHDMGRDSWRQEYGIDLEKVAFEYGCRFLWTRLNAIEWRDE